MYKMIFHTIIILLLWFLLYFLLDPSRNDLYLWQLMNILMFAFWLMEQKKLPFSHLWLDVLLCCLFYMATAIITIMLAGIVVKPFLIFNFFGDGCFHNMVAISVIHFLPGQRAIVGFASCFFGYHHSINEIVTNVV